MLQLLLFVASLWKAHGTEVGFCQDYNGTLVTMDQIYFQSPCEQCECVNFDGEEVGPCIEMGFTCPCDTRCCLAECQDSNEPNDAASKSVESNFTLIVSMSCATIVIVLALVFYLYRRRVTSYVRVTRRLYLQQRQQSMENEPKPATPDAPPHYEDIAMDSGGVHVVSPPRYEDVAPAYSRNPTVHAPPDVSE